MLEIQTSDTMIRVKNVIAWRGDIYKIIFNATPVVNILSFISNITRYRTQNRSLRS